MIGDAIDTVATLIVIGMFVVPILFIALFVSKVPTPEERDRQRHFEVLNDIERNRQWTQEWEDERRNKR